ncbi:NAD(P)-dependent alcohol dehydrogenase [uncultured Maritimibacter sp.]|jgi:aryl-alcohol dehydrogenase|uniref:NAD(P)-dependent alcohol dehydrogenase n=1 Tax=uncultured Maritimibacter sp. TaxID=991866 RepID=UPI000A73EBE4|nr:NAD(P)-dependent alcohol dehydrogenase [uncultured Maritimibacter sp.]
MSLPIKAAVARQQDGTLTIEDLVLEAPRDTEILVRVVASGICHTDLVVMAGHLPTPLPVVLGHEGSGIVEAVGSRVTKVRPGDSVVMTYNTCGTCPSCRDGAMSYCHEFFPRNFFATRADGSVALATGASPGEKVHSNFFGQSSWATHALAHERNVVKVEARGDDLALMGPLACGIQTGAGTVMNALAVTAGSSFVCFGAGSVGLSAIMAAVVQGATRIIAVDMHDNRLAIARELGATHTINAASDDVVAQVKAVTGGGATYALDTTGLTPVIRQAVEALAPRGTAAVLGAPAPGAEIVIDNTDFMSSGKRLMGVVEGESDGDTFIPKLVDLWRSGWFPFDKLVTFYPFADINIAIRDSHAGTAIKPILRMG